MEDKQKQFLLRVHTLLDVEAIKRMGEVEWDLRQVQEFTKKGKLAFFLTIKKKIDKK